MNFGTLRAARAFAILGSELVNTFVAKKASQAVRLLMMVLTAVLIFFFINVMLLVSDIQGTARVVNYAGLVRGTTQRIVKLEDAGQPQDDLLKAVDSYINGLRYGSDGLNLVRLDDDEYQAKMTELAGYFDELKTEIARVREVGYENTDIIAMSEEFFGICDDATRLAEDYSQEKATALNRLEGLVIIDIVGLVATFAVELARAVRTAALNRELQNKVYLDEATGLPNKNKCEEILGQGIPFPPKRPLRCASSILTTCIRSITALATRKATNTFVLLPISWGVWRQRPALLAATAAMNLSRCCGMPIELPWNPASLGFA